MDSQYFLRESWGLMSNYEKWHEILEHYFRNVTEEQLMKDTEAAGITLIKLKKFRIKSSHKVRRRYLWS